MTVRKVKGEVLWLDIKGGLLNVKDAEGSVHIIRAMPRKLRDVEKGSKVEIKLKRSRVEYIKKWLS
ncbi:MAG TPA: hypothetical protein VNK81_01440 [Thermodesulfobacteriota bacterium]|nr:hypothetical protein [Thermodesulfobacteriota bacterium]